MSIQNNARKLPNTLQGALANVLTETTKLRPKQRQVFRTDYRRLCCFCGRGWGKSRTMNTLMAFRALTIPNFQGAMIAATMPMAKKTFLESPIIGIQRLIPPPVGRFNHMMGTFYIDEMNSSIKFLGSNDPDKARGLENDGIAVDEAATMNAPELYDDLVRTLRGGASGKAQMACFSTPLFDDLSIKIRDEADYLINGASNENTFLSEDYIDDLREGVSEAQFQMEYLGIIPDTIPGSMFPQSKFKECESDYEGFQAGDQMSIFIDPSATSGGRGSNTGCVIAVKRGEIIHIIDAYEWEMSPTVWVQTVANIAKDRSVHGVYIETQLGTAHLDMLKKAAMEVEYPTERVRGVSATKSKIERAERASHLFMSDRLKFGKGGSGPTAAMTLLKSQCALFSREEQHVKNTKKKRDDMVDALAHACNKLSPRKSGTPMLRGVTP